MTGLQKVLDNIRPSFEYNLQFVKDHIQGTGLDMGCGNCPLIHEGCLLHVDQADQPIAKEQVPPEKVLRGDATKYVHNEFVDYIFSSHMLEDLPTREAMLECLKYWSMSLKDQGKIVLLMPDMEGRRYPRVEDDGGNPSHRINVGAGFMLEMEGELDKLGLFIIQLDTIPHDKSCTFDVVLKKGF